MAAWAAVYLAQNVVAVELIARLQRGRKGELGELLMNVLFILIKQVINT